MINLPADLSERSRMEQEADVWHCWKRFLSIFAGRIAQWVHELNFTDHQDLTFHVITLIPLLDPDLKDFYQFPKM